MKDIITYLNETAPDFDTYYMAIVEIYEEISHQTIGNWAKRHGVDLHASKNGKNAWSCSSQVAAKNGKTGGRKPPKIFIDFLKKRLDTTGK